MKLVDIGANLTHESFRHDLPEVLARARESGVTRIVVTGAGEQESRASRALAARYPGTLYATAGMHPHLARDWHAGMPGFLRELARFPEVVAIGETGLDFNRDFSPRDQQERAFEAQLELAGELEMPVFMHERDAHHRFAAIVRRHRHRLVDAVVHCFTGDGEALSAYLDLDLYVGITGWICDERRGTRLRELVRRVPAERLMLETDAPYLLPRDLETKPKTRRNEPMYLAHILRVVAACRDETPQALAELTSSNAERFFRLTGTQAHPPSGA